MSPIRAIAAVFMICIQFAHAGGVNDGLLAHWTFDEEEGAIAIDSTSTGADAEFSGDFGWGEGVINGLLTARIGIAAISVCRPAPFVETDGPTISDFMGELISTAKETDETKPSN